MSGSHCSTSSFALCIIAATCCLLAKPGRARNPSSRNVATSSGERPFAYVLACAAAVALTTTAVREPFRTICGWTARSLRAPSVFMMYSAHNWLGGRLLADNTQETNLAQYGRRDADQGAVKAQQTYVSELSAQVWKSSCTCLVLSFQGPGSPRVRSPTRPSSLQVTRGGMPALHSRVARSLCSATKPLRLEVSAQVQPC